MAIARVVVIADTDSAWLRCCVDGWLGAGGAASAEDILAELLSRDVRATRRMEVAAGFAEAGLLAPAVTLWLDVVRYHGEAIDQAVLAVSCLVKCGHRTDVTAVLAEALADSRTTPAAAVGLRALRVLAGADGAA